jgi:hypothetical protein
MNAIIKAATFVGILSVLLTSDSRAEVVAGSAPFNGPGLGIQKFGQALTQNTGLMCTQATGYAGYLLAYQASTGMALEIAGVVAAGAITVPGADGVSRKGVGAVALSAGGLWNATSQVFGSGGSILAQYSVDMGTSVNVPASAADAEALFDKAFGTAARGGVKFNRTRKSSTGATYAYWGTVTQTLPSVANQTAVVTRGIVVREGRVVALDTAGSGAWSVYAY